MAAFSGWKNGRLHGHCVWGFGRRIYVYDVLRSGSYRVSALDPCLIYRGSAEELKFIVFIRTSIRRLRGDAGNVDGAAFSLVARQPSVRLPRRLGVVEPFGEGVSLKWALPTRAMR